MGVFDFINRLLGGKPNEKAAAPAREKGKPSEATTGQYGGVIAAIKLEKWWGSLAEEDRGFIRECWGSAMGNRSSANLDHPTARILFTSQTASQFLNSYAGWAITAKRHALAFNMLDESLTCTKGAVDRHFAYNALIDLTYKLREADPACVTRCIGYCLEDIALFPKFKEGWVEADRKNYLHLADAFAKTGQREQEKEYRKKALTVKWPDLRIPSFERLAIIYEKQGRFAEAIDVCDKAICYDLKDSTKGGFPARREKLQKKLAKIGA